MNRATPAGCEVRQGHANLVRTSETRLEFEGRMGKDVANQRSSQEEGDASHDRAGGKAGHATEKVAAVEKSKISQ
jgi:hypothetical protein